MVVTDEVVDFFTDPFHSDLSSLTLLALSELIPHGVIVA